MRVFVFVLLFFLDGRGAERVFWLCGEGGGG